MTYFVYENWTHKKAVVHRAECGHCNHGQGAHRAASGKNGRWHGPYLTEDLSLIHARSLMQARVSLCATCASMRSTA